MKYIVNINIGFQGHEFGEEFESDSPECAAAVDKGYLVTLTTAPVYSGEAKSTTLRMAGLALDLKKVSDRQ